MSERIKKLNIFQKEGRLLFKYLIFSFIFFLTAMLLLKYPTEVGDGIKNGVFLCFEKVIPSTFPFLFFSTLYISFKGNRPSKLSQKASSFLFNLPADSVSVIFISLIGGYPVGGKMICQLYERKKLSLDEARRMLLFCVCPAPSFVIGFVGSYIYKSTIMGVIIYLSVVLSSLFLGFLTKFISKEKTEEKIFSIKREENKKDYVNLFVSAGNNSAFSMGIICCWIVIFSGVVSLVNIFPISENFKLFLFGTLEVTNAVEICSGKLTPELIAGIIAWGGLSVHFQILSQGTKIMPELKHFFTSRIIHSAFSMVICKIATMIFPISIKTSAPSGESFYFSNVSNIPLSIFIIISCIIFLLGRIEINHKVEKAK